jgi:hypothetical protein
MTDPWKIYDVSVPSYVNDRYSERLGYWIYVKRLHPEQWTICTARRLFFVMRGAGETFSPALFVSGKG